MHPARVLPASSPVSKLKMPVIGDPQPIADRPTGQRHAESAFEGPAGSGQFYRPLIRLVLMLSDALFVLAAFRIAYWIRFSLKLTVAPEVIPSSVFYSDVVSVLVPMWVCLYALRGAYTWEDLFGGTAEYSRIFSASTLAAMFVVVATFLAPSFIVSRTWILTSWLLSSALTCGARFLSRRIVYVLRKHGRCLTPALVIGANGEARSLAEQLLDHQVAGYELVGVVETSASSIPGRMLRVGEASLPVLGSIHDIVSVVTRHNVKEVIVAASCLERGQLLDLFEVLQPLAGVTMHLSTGLYEVLTTGVAVRTCASVPLIRLNKLRLGRFQGFLKACVEYLITVVALLVLSPVIALIAILVKLDSPGPLIYRHRVLGVGGRVFYAFKFRTMRTDGNEILGRMPQLANELRQQGKLKDDPRVTRLGRILRRYSLDELPQFVNVLRGEMGVVGPRFITPEEAARYGPYKTNLITVKPGITGLWQVSGRSELSYEDRARLDMHYIRHYSLWMDLQILFVQTPSAVIRARGAY